MKKRRSEGGNHSLIVGIAHLEGQSYMGLPHGVVRLVVHHRARQCGTSHFKAIFPPQDYIPHETVKITPSPLLQFGELGLSPGGAGCDGVPTDAPVWECRGHSVCSNHDSHILYGWAKDAAAMHVPKGVGFRVGPGSGTKVLVLQVSLPCSPETQHPCHAMPIEGCLFSPNPGAASRGVSSVPTPAPLRGVV